MATTPAQGTIRRHREEAKVTLTYKNETPDSQWQNDPKATYAVEEDET